MAPRVAAITGITGQDGSYLTELLLARGYRVFGLVRRSSQGNTGLLPVGHERLTLVPGDVLDLPSVLDLLTAAAAAAVDGEPEVYNLAAQSHVHASFDSPAYTTQVDALGALHVLEGVRRVCPRARLVQASTSEMFGSSPPPQSESTPMMPCSPYAASKLYAYWAVRTYRESYGLHASNAVSFNHESERRGAAFVTRKIAAEAARWAVTGKSELRLGNLDARRDWGHAADYVRALWLIAGHDTADDFVVATGESHSVREFFTAAFEYAGAAVQFAEDGRSAVDARTGEVLLTVDDSLRRPTEVPHLRGDARKLRAATGWVPVVDFGGLVRRMVSHEIQALV